MLVILSSTGCNRRLEYERRQAAMEKVKELGGTVEIDEEKPERATLTVSLMDCNVGDAELRFLKDLHGLDTLDLRGTKINGEGLICLKDMASVRRLWLHHCPITDAGARQSWHNWRRCWHRIEETVEA